MSSIMRSIKRQTVEGLRVVKQRRQLTQMLKSLRAEATDEKNIRKHIKLVWAVNKLRALKESILRGHGPDEELT